jgi:hypothetical protein
MKKISVIKFLICFLHVVLIRASSLEEIFTHIYESNVWGSKESFSGPGSELLSTREIRKALPELFKKFNIKILLDLPCGDFFWMKEVDISYLDLYIGGDIVKNLIAKNKSAYQTDKKHFTHIDVVASDLSYADCILCRDCLVHLSYKDIFKALENFKKSGSRYLLTTTFPNLDFNKNIQPGRWRPLNLELPPFNFPRPKKIICENESYKGFNKHIALWSLDDIDLTFFTVE